MGTAAAARAERALRDRHREAWPANAYCYDLDEVRRTTGRKLLVEVPAGLAALTAEYKAVEDGPLDLGDLQFQVVEDVTHPDLPAFAAQFTHPEMNPPQPWAFRLWPLNDVARHRVGPVELTERAYVQLNYLLARGPVGAGGEVRTYRRRGQATPEVRTIMGPWSELAHLDDRFPDPAVWPDVTEARPRAFSRLPERPWRIVGQYLAEHGRALGVRAHPAEVRVLARSPRALEPVGPGPVTEARRRLGLLRSDPAPPPPAPAPAVLARTRETDDRFSRVRTELTLAYRRMWAEEAASDDNRDTWRAWDPDGSPRWAFGA